MFRNYLKSLIVLAITMRVTKSCDNLASITVKENIPYPSAPLLDVFSLFQRDQIMSEEDKDNMYLTDSTGSKPFTLAKGKLFVNGPLDREQICSPKKQANRFSISRCCGIHCCLYVGVTSTSRNVYIKITIDDENDNEPTFPQLSIKKQINENVKLGFNIAIPKATDLDSEKYGLDRYNIIQDKNCPDCFQVKSDTLDGSLVLVTKIMVDREIHSAFHLQVLGIDKGVPARTGTLSVEIEVVDVNDNSPHFEETSLSLSVDENGRSGREIHSIKVTDADSGENSKMTYEIEDFTFMAQKHFRLFPERGGVGLVLLTTLDYEAISEFHFKIVAKDQGYPSLSSSLAVNIQVVNINDESPEIMFYQRGQVIHPDNVVLHLPENSPKQQTIISIHVTDRDSKMSEINCEVMLPRDVFYLHDNQQVNVLEKKKLFDLQNSVVFDREVTNSYRIRIACSDSSGDHKLTQHAEIQLRITDKNDNFPTFSSSFYFGTILETNSLDKVVEINEGIKVIDDDIEMNSRISFSLLDVGNSSDSQKFSIANHNPRIKNIAPIDYEERKRYVFLIVAQDGGTPSLSSSATVTVNVLDANDNRPEIAQRFYSFSVLEEEPIGTEIGQIFATDSDSAPGNKDFIFEIVSHDGTRDGSRPNKLFTIDNNTGKIKTRQKLDHEKDQQVNFFVRVRNTNENILFPDKSELNGDSASINVKIIDINDNFPKIILKESQNFGGIQVNEPPKRLFIEINHDRQATSNPCVPFPYTFSDADEGINAEVRVTLKDNPHFLLEMGHNLICPKNDNLAAGQYTVYVIGEDRNGGNGSKYTEHQINVVVKSNVLNASKIPQKAPRQDMDEKLGDYKAIIIFIVLIAAIVLFCLLLMIVVVKTKLCIPRNLSPRTREKATDKQNNASSNKNYNIIMPGGDCENTRFYNDYIRSGLNNQNLNSSNYSKTLFYPQCGTSNLDAGNYYQNHFSTANKSPSSDQIIADHCTTDVELDLGDSTHKPDQRYEQLRRGTSQGPGDNSSGRDASKCHQYNYLLEQREGGSLHSDGNKSVLPKHDLVAVASGLQKSIHDVYLQTSFV